MNFKEIMNLGQYTNEKELINLFLLNNAIEYNKINGHGGPSYLFCELDLDLDDGKHSIIVHNYKFKYSKI